MGSRPAHRLVRPQSFYGYCCHGDTQGTARVPERRIEQLIRRHFDLRPKGIVQMLDLPQPIYRQTTCNAHLGRSEPELTSERTDQAADLAAELDRDAAD